MKSSALAAIALACCLAAGCGGGADVKTTTTTVSVGQQLIDLKKARDSGAMTADEFERSKKQLINRVLED